MAEPDDTAAANDPTDLTVRLQWPQDPLMRAPDMAAPGDAGDRLDDLEKALAALPRDLGDLPGLERRFRSLEELIVKTDGALRALNAAVESWVERNTAVIDDRMNALLARVEGAVAEVQAHNDEFIDRVSKDLNGMRRRLQLTVTPGTAPASDDGFIEELVTRVADEVEIRIAATKSKPSRRTRS